MKRREFIAGSAGAVVWPMMARGQQTATPVIGFLSGIDGRSTYAAAHLLPAFRQGLKNGGYVEGQNVAIEYRWADGRYDRLPALAADLVRRRVNAIFATDNASARTAKQSSSTIPIVVSVGADPVKLGLVASIARPGGNVTGASFLSTNTQAIRPQMLHEAVPGAVVIGALMNPGNPNAEPNTQEMREAARTLGLELHVLNAGTEREIDAAFPILIGRHIEALVIDGDPFYSSQIEQLATLTLRHRIPAIYATRDFVDAGGLIIYGASNTDAYRVAGGYVGRILKGDKPTDLPVQQVTKVELVINLKTAKTLGLTVPETLLATANEVIQ